MFIELFFGFYLTNDNNLIVHHLKIVTCFISSGSKKKIKEFIFHSTLKKTTFIYVAFSPNRNHLTKK